MSKPLQTKDAKPKEENSPQAAQKPFTNVNTNVMIVANTIVTILIVGIFMVIMYSFFDSMITKKMAAYHSEGEQIEETQSEDERGILLDLGDFILNLADASPRRYLKVNVAMELSKTTEEIEMLNSPQKEAGGHGSAPVNPMDSITAEMEQYKPAIRDAVISVMSNKTSDELSSSTGKELAKEEIKEMVNAVFDGSRDVLRVSFGQFIIQ